MFKGILTIANPLLVSFQHKFRILLVYCTSKNIKHTTKMAKEESFDIECHLKIIIGWFEICL